MSAGERLAGTPEPMAYWMGAGGVRIAGDHWGPDDGPLVLLLHGGGQTRHAWKGTGEALGGRGTSPSPSTPAATGTPTGHPMGCTAPTA
ncbi:MAG: hypothetical protein R2755_13245 [Acidimicrobiales bacterium]